MTDYIKNKIEAQRKIQEQIEIESNREYVDKTTQQNQLRRNQIKVLEEYASKVNIVNVEIDAELLKKIDQEAVKDLRTRKAQVLYIIREHFNKSEEK